MNNFIYFRYSQRWFIITLTAYHNKVAAHLHQTQKPLIITQDTAYHNMAARAARK